jgi:hypothetical protein
MLWDERKLNCERARIDREIIFAILVDARCTAAPVPLSIWIPTDLIFGQSSSSSPLSTCSSALSTSIYVVHMAVVAGIAAI